MGNTDSVPVVSQLKSLTQFAFGNATAARETQNNFLYNNTFPVISQVESLIYAIGGEPDKALDLQKKFADDMQRIVDSIPVAGHIKGGVHYALGENEKGDEAMKAASRSTGVAVGGVGGFLAGGPAGAVVGGVAGGAAMDGIITGSEILINKDEAKPYGYVAAGVHIANAVENKTNFTVEHGFDIAMMPVGDGLAGYASGSVIGKPLGLNTVGAKAAGLPKAGFMGVEGGAPIKPIMTAGDIARVTGSKTASAVGGAAETAETRAFGAGTKFKLTNVVDDVAANEIERGAAQTGNRLGLDKAALDNRANQLNPNHVASGPGRPAGYQGLGTRTDLNNHANQLNPNNALYRTG